jgi:hypothetical protein
VLQRRVQDPLALRVLEGEFAAGDTVTVDADPAGAGVRFSRTPAARPVESPV